MGVVIHKDHQQKGVMSEILKAVLLYGFNVLGLNRIVGDIFAENKGSKRLLEKYGFRQEGILRQTDYDGERYFDTIVYSMLKSEFVRLIGEKNESSNRVPRKNEDKLSE